MISGSDRLRANYTPKGLQLNQEEDVNGSSHVAPEARVGPAVDGIVNMMRRIYQLEGVPGMYKGFSESRLISSPRWVLE
jgi:hypothetical protein